MNNMKFRHILEIILVVLIWGFNFVIIKIGLSGFSPLLLCFARFFLAGFPAVFFVKRPSVPFVGMVAYGLFNFVGQFVFLFTGMFLGVSAGLASIILQIQVFITLALAAVFLREQPNMFQVAGAIVSSVGIGLLAFHAGGDVTLSGLCFVLMAALSWACGNIVAKSFRGVDVFGLVVWGSALASAPLFVLCVYVDGWTSITNSVEKLGIHSILALAYLVYPTTLLGYAFWNKLLGHYRAAQIVPFTLLVPVVGLASSVLVLSEPLEEWKIASSVLVFSGLCINVLAPRLMQFYRVSRRISIR
ncbi:EamA family transporter [Nguyenibacter vanlangensis]|uniref:EamA family transporter n=1 Tax=Nguyenibacter vanlangensis TaxID=1216886 RepID=A0ABZ3D0V9_9PROT